MKIHRYELLHFAIQAALAIGIAATSDRVHAEDMLKVAPHNTKVLFENDQVRVLETKLGPGESLARHSHPARVNYFLNAARERITYPGKKPQIFSRNAGEVAYFGPVSLEVKNVGTTQVHNIVVELKQFHGEALD